jgi:hypothetical protein
MKDTCQQNDDLYQLLGTTGVAVLFIFSEFLPFIKTIKSNGILDFIVKTLSKEKDEEVALIDVP